MFEYLFTFYPVVDLPMWQLYVGLIGGGIILLAGMFMGSLQRLMSADGAWAKAFKKVYVRTANWYTGLGIALLLLTWLQIEKVPLLGMQIWWWIVILGIIVLEVWNLQRFMQVKKRIAKADVRRGKG